MTAAPQTLGGATDDQSQQQGAWEIVGAVKIKDGLFLGDDMAAQELEFVVTNKVTHVVNCCGRQVPNHWEPIGVVYLTYYWLDNDSQVILDTRDVVVDELTAFVDEALDNAESVLIHSERGQGRSCTVLCAYLMRKYRWGMRKALEFLQSRRPDVNLKPGYLQQLSAFERRLISYQKLKLSSDWSLSSVTPKLDSEEYLLRNTFMNSQMGPLADLTIRPDADQKPLGYGKGVNGIQRRSIDWSDAGTDDKGRLEVPGNPPRPHRPSTAQPVKSCLKGTRQKERQATAERLANDSSPDTAKGERLNRAIRSSSLTMASVDALDMSVELRGSSRRSSLDGSLLRTLSGAKDDVREEPLWRERGRDQSDREIASSNIGHPSRLGSTRIPTRAWGETSMEEASVRPPTPKIKDSAVEERISNKMDMWASGRGEQGQRRLPSPTMGSSNPLRSSSLGRRDPSPSSRQQQQPQQQYGGRYGQRDPSPRSQRFYSSGREGSCYQRSDSPMMRSYQRSVTPQLQDRRSLRGSSGGMGSLMSASSGTSSLRQQYMGSSGLRSSQGSSSLVGGLRAAATTSGLGSLDPSKRGLPGSAVGRRPSTAPSLANGSMRTSPTGSYNRPPSPSVRSRPASPSMSSQRPSSPSPQMMQNHGSSSSMKGGPVGSGAPFDRVRHRSLTGHMRRAPSPTPAFNRNAQSGKPRWRM